MTDLLATLERTAAREVGRGSAQLLAYSAGGLRAAATSLLATPAPEVVILTGFYIPGATPAGAETDGPLGAVQIAAALTALGATVRLLTDAPCEPVVAAAAAAALSTPVAVDVAPLPDAAGQAGYQAWQRDALRRYASVTHMIAVERVGPSEDGRPRNMRGHDISAHTAPLDQIYRGGPWYTVGIGDGGNELGMGTLSRDLVAAAVPNGARIRCIVPSDALIVAGTSNWGAAALVAALSHLAGLPELSELLTTGWSQDVLARMQHAGAVDGVLLRPADGVDGLPWTEYIEPVVLMRHSLAAGATTDQSPTDTLTRILAPHADREIKAASACPAEILALQVSLRPVFIGFDGQLHTGLIEVHRDAADDIEELFARALAIEFPFERVVPASAFSWDDRALMAANATSGFNYRTIAGSSKISCHALGIAIDVNTRLNPYCRYEDDTLVIEPPGALWRPEPGRDSSGVLYSTHPLIEFMRTRGWEWGGDWDLKIRHVVDYQHLQKPNLADYTMT